MTDNFNRRDVLRAAVAGAAVYGTGSAAHAQSTWPTKPVTMIVPFPAGGGTDAFARPLFAAMTKNTGKQFVSRIADSLGGGGHARRPRSDRQTGRRVRMRQDIVLQGCAPVSPPAQGLPARVTSPCPLLNGTRSARDSGRRGIAQARTPISAQTPPHCGGSTAGTMAHRKRNRPVRP